MKTKNIMTGKVEEVPYVETEHMYNDKLDEFAKAMLIGTLSMIREDRTTEIVAIECYKMAQVMMEERKRWIKK